MAIIYLFGFLIFIGIIGIHYCPEDFCIRFIISCDTISYDGL
jgi:hypothetical protein